MCTAIHRSGTLMSTNGPRFSTRSTAAGSLPASVVPSSRARSVSTTSPATSATVQASIETAPALSTSPALGRTLTIPSLVSSTPSRALRRVPVSFAFEWLPIWAAAVLWWRRSGSDRSPDLRSSSSSIFQPVPVIGRSASARRRATSRHSGHLASSIPSSSARPDSLIPISSRRRVGFVHASSESHIQASRCPSLLRRVPELTSSRTAIRFAGSAHITPLRLPPSAVRSPGLPRAPPRPRRG